jgi:hypothetical protein
MKIHGLVPTNLENHQDEAVSILRYYAEEFDRGLTSRADLAASLLKQAAQILEQTQRTLKDTEALCVSYQSVHRWSVTKDGHETLYVCRGNHDNGEGCEWEVWVPKKQVEDDQEDT